MSHPKGALQQQHQHQVQRRTDTVWHVPAWQLLCVCRSVGGVVCRGTREGPNSSSISTALVLRLGEGVRHLRVMCAQHSTAQH
jgi:hypothetical protein